MKNLAGAAGLSPPGMAMRHVALFAFLFAVLSSSAASGQDATAAGALRLFERHKPNIEAAIHAVVAQPVALTGNLNCNGRTDAVVFFGMTSAEGGNAIVDREAAVYPGSSKGLRVAGAFPTVPECWAPDAIRIGVVYATAYECAPPYNTAIGEVQFRWNGKKMVLAPRRHLTA